MTREVPQGEQGGHQVARRGPRSRGGHRGQLLPRPARVARPGAGDGEHDALHAGVVLPQLAQQPDRLLQRGDRVGEASGDGLGVRREGERESEPRPVARLAETVLGDGDVPVDGVHLAAVAVEHRAHQVQRRPCPRVGFGQPPVDRGHAAGGVVGEQRGRGLDQRRERMRRGPGPPADQGVVAGVAAGHHGVEQVAAERGGLRVPGDGSAALHVQRGPQPPRRLRVIALDHPERRHRGAEPHGRSGVAAVGGELERREDVVAFGGEQGDPFELLGAAQVRLGPFRQVQEAREVRGPDPVGLPRLGQPLPPVLPDGLQHAEARLGPVHGLEQRPVGQGVQDVQGVRAAGHAGGGPGRDHAGEHREPLGEPAFPLVQEVPAPLDDGPQRPVPGQGGAVPVAQQAEAVAEAGGELVRRHRAHPGRGELDRQRQAVQPPADAPDRLGVVAGEPGPHGRGPLGEQLDRRREAERRHGAQRLAVHPEAFPAGREDAQAGAGAEQLVGEPGRRVHHVLAVVEDDQRLVRRQRLGQVGAVPQPEHGRDRPAHLAGVAHRGQLHQPHPAGEPPAQLRRDRGRQPRLPRAPGSDERDEPSLPEPPGDPRALVLPADEAAARHPQIAPDPFARRVPQDDHIGVLQLAPRIGAQLLGQGAPEPLEHRERLGGAPRPMQGLHQHDAKPFPQRMPGRQLLQLGHQRPGVGAGGQFGGRPVLRGRQPQLLQPHGRRVRERRPGRVGQRVPAPESQGLPQPRGGQRRVPGPERSAALRDQPLELLHVDGIDVQGIAAGHRPQPSRGQAPPQPVDERLQRVHPVPGPAVRPQRRGERIDGDGPPRLQRQPDQQHPQPGPADHDVLAPVRHDQRPKGLNPHAPILSTAPGNSVSPREPGSAGGSSASRRSPVRPPRRRCFLARAGCGR
ncbi:hypothetical protein FHX41_0242 [Actinomadura hallensis]|uniref:Uncharacterized protein n=1 Tax=Actinomadura hallensis TaxID=337895 RepID=A0A543I7X0_9ACTN|nr:hypothetical protein FHX41_0242 [Actinomadura hallensis]